MYSEKNKKIIIVTTETNQMHYCYKSILQNFFFMFRSM
jgi:ribosomal protein S17